MATTGQKFYPRANDQDQSWGTDIDALEDSSPATPLNGSTQTVHSTDAGPYPVTCDPQTAKAAVANPGDDTRTNFGWALNEDTPEPAMDSEANATRIIPAGTWTFRAAISHLATSATDLSPPTIAVEWSIYRVATGGGTRTFLFSAQSAAQTVAGLGAAGSQDHSQTSSQPEYEFAAGETMHLAIRIVSRASTALLFGAVTNTTTTLFLNNESSTRQTSVEVPSPGIRTKYAAALSDSPAAADAITRQVVYPRALADSPAVADAVTRAATYARSMDDTAGIPTDGLIRVFSGARALDDEAGTPDDTIVRVWTGARSLADVAGFDDDTLERQFMGARSLDDAAGIPDDDLTRIAIFPRALDDDAGIPDDMLERLAIFNRSMADEAGIPDDDLARQFMGARSLDDVAGVPSDELTRQFTGARSLDDDAGFDMDSLARVAIFNRMLADAAGIPTDNLLRQMAYGRALADEAGADTDSLGRVVIYARTLEDSLSEGGGTTVIRPVILLVDD